MESLVKKAQTPQETKCPTKDGVFKTPLLPNTPLTKVVDPETKKPITCESIKKTFSKFKNDKQIKDLCNKSYGTYIAHNGEPVYYPCGAYTNNSKSSNDSDYICKFLGYMNQLSCLCPYLKGSEAGLHPSQNPPLECSAHKTKSDCEQYYSLPGSQEQRASPPPFYQCKWTFEPAEGKSTCILDNTNPC